MIIIIIVVIIIITIIITVIITIIIVIITENSFIINVGIINVYYYYYNLEFYIVSNKQKEKWKKIALTAMWK